MFNITTIFSYLVERAKLCNTGAGFERYIIKQLRSHGLNVIDLRHHPLPNMPDIFVLDKSGTGCYIELKCYRSCDTFLQFMKKWMRQQPEQYREIMKLRKGFPVFLLVQLKYDTRLI